MRQIIIGSFIGFVLAAAFMAACGGGGGVVSPQNAEVESRLTALENQMTGVGTTMADLAEGQADLETAVADLGDELSALTAGVADMNPAGFFRYESSVTSDVALPVNVHNATVDDTAAHIRQVTFTPKGDYHMPLTVLVTGDLDIVAQNRGLILNLTIESNGGDPAVSTKQTVDFLTTGSHDLEIEVRGPFVALAAPATSWTVTLWAHEAADNIDATIDNLMFTVCTVEGTGVVLEDSDAFS